MSPTASCVIAVCRKAKAEAGENRVFNTLKRSASASLLRARIADATSANATSPKSYAASAT
ncbi:MAG: hypothetical protein M3081_06230 [Gemmatimonadota bacterium]|nr:hypothetical protein [Gemmatimonadota bacterium]